MRILFGAYLLLYFGLRLPHVPMLFSEAGLTIPFDLYLPEFLRFVLAPPSAPVAYGIFAVLIASLTAFTLGFKTRTSATIALLLFVYSTLLSFHHSSTSYNRLFLFLLFLFTFSGAGNTYSIDMARKHGSVFAWEPASIITQRLIAVQITMTYLIVGWQKTWLPMWQGGEVLSYSFQGMWATPIAWWVVRQPIPMVAYDALVFLVKALEISFPVGFWIRRFRWWAFSAGLLFNLSVTLFIAAIWWFYALIACYLCFFEPEEVHAAAKRWENGTMEKCLNSFRRRSPPPHTLSLPSASSASSPCAAHGEGSSRSSSAS